MQQSSASRSVFASLKGDKIKPPKEYGLIPTRAIYQHDNRIGCSGHPDEYTIPVMSIEENSTKTKMDFSPSFTHNKLPVSKNMMECLDITALKQNVNSFSSFSSESAMKKLQAFVKPVPSYMVKELWLPSWLVKNNSPKPAFDTNYFKLLDQESICVAMNSPHINNEEICPSNPSRVKYFDDPSYEKKALQEPIIAFSEQWQKKLLTTDAIQQKSVLLMLRKNLKKAEKESFNMKLRTGVEQWLDGKSTLPNPFGVGQVKAIIRGNADKFTEEERSVPAYAVSNQEIAEWKAKFAK